MNLRLRQPILFRRYRKKQAIDVLQQIWRGEHPEFPPGLNLVRFRQLLETNSDVQDEFYWLVEADIYVSSVAPGEDGDFSDRVRLWMKHQEAAGTVDGRVPTWLFPVCALLLLSVIAAVLVMPGGLIEQARSMLSDPEPAVVAEALPERVAGLQIEYACARSFAANTAPKAGCPLGGPLRVRYSGGDAGGLHVATFVVQADRSVRRGSWRITPVAPSPVEPDTLELPGDGTLDAPLSELGDNFVAGPSVLVTFVADRPFPWPEAERAISQIAGSSPSNIAHAVFELRTNPDVRALGVIAVDTRPLPITDAGEAGD